MSIKFSVLGPVPAWRGPFELNVGPNQQRAILALLLVRANQLVPVDDMIELLWEENPPASAVNVVHKYIGSVRHLLEPGLEARASGRWLTRHGAGYRLAARERLADDLGVDLARKYVPCTAGCFGRNCRWRPPRTWLTRWSGQVLLTLAADEPFRARHRPAPFLPWCLPLSCPPTCPPSQVASRSWRSCPKCSAPPADVLQLPFARSMAWRASARPPSPFTGRTT